MTDTSQLDLVVAANFTAEPVGPSLAFWLRELQLPASVRYAPFDQVFQQLLDPGSLLRSSRVAGAVGTGLLLLRLQNWLAADAATTPERLAGELVDAVGEALDGAGTQLLICFCPPTRLEPAAAEALARAEAIVAEALAGKSGVRVLTSAATLERYPCARIADEQGDRVAGIPYAPEFFAVLGTALARCLYGLVVPAHKVLVLDCDDTLWGGLCGELGPLGVELSDEHLALQRFAVEQRHDGKLICLASRNEEADVFAVFDQNPGMQLTRDDLTAWQIHWGLKSDSLAELAAKLGLGLDSFVFLDDDPLQCAEVRRRFPEVLTLQVPRRGVAAFCRNIWPLDPRSRTREGGRRTGSYREHVAREDLRASSQSFQQFLDSLELEVDVAPVGEGDLARASELTFRTNQFNLTGRRVSEADFRHLLQQDATSCFAVRVRDRFGDYGLVGLVVAERAGADLRVPVMLLSCRALGRGVEHRMVAHLGRLAKEQGAGHVLLRCTPSERNTPAREFLHQLGDVHFADDGTLQLTLTAERAQAVRLAPMAAARAAEAPVTSEDGGGSGRAAEAARRAAFLATIPTDLADAGAVFTAVHGAVETASTEEASDAGDPVGALLVALFKKQLGIAEVPGDVGFFELGGQSLQAMQILAEASSAFAVELAPTLLFTTNFTVDELAGEIDFLRDGDDPESAVSDARLPTPSGR